MTVHSTISFGGQLTHAGYKDIPVAYLNCTKDIVVTPELQQGFIDMMVNEAGVSVEIHELAASHAPIVSLPKTVGQIIRRVAGEKV